MPSKRLKQSTRVLTEPTVCAGLTLPDCTLWYSGSFHKVWDADICVVQLPLVVTHSQLAKMEPMIPSVEKERVLIYQVGG